MLTVELQDTELWKRFDSFTDLMTAIITREVELQTHLQILNLTLIVSVACLFE